MNTAKGPDTVSKRQAPIQVVTYGTDLVAAHYRLGEDVRIRAQMKLAEDLKKVDRSGFKQQIRRVRKCAGRLNELGSQKDPTGQIINRYLECLSAWAEGAKVSQVECPVMSMDGQKITTLDRALYMQAEFGGCQTGIYRDEQGGIILWHTEEDIGARFDKLRVAVFPDEQGELTIHAFIYPDLLPGPALGWRNGVFVQAVDMLLATPDPQGVLLGNIACWASLFLHGRIDLGKLIKSLSPFYTGYAITTVSRGQGRIDAHRLEFWGHKSLNSILGDEQGAYLFQSNVFSDPRSELAIAYEEMTPAHRKVFDNRIERTEQALRRLGDEKGTLPFFYRLLCSRQGGSYAYSNADVKAHFLCRLSRTDTELRIGPGPARARGEHQLVWQNYHF